MIKIYNVKLESIIGIFKNTRTKKKNPHIKKKKELYIEQIMNYIKPELVIVSVALYFIGIALKKSEVVRDKYIPMILGGAGIVVCGIYVVATCDLGGVKNIAMAVFTAIIQGILVAGLSNYVNQLIKQSGKEE